MADEISSEGFARRARHPQHPNAFTRSRALPLPALIAALLTMRGTSQQSMLDAFYGSLCGTSEFVHGITDRGFAKARSRLHMPALTWLNDWLLQRVDSMGWVPRWHGLRVVLGDASALMSATRACHRTRSLAPAQQRLFSLFLAGAELTLHASVHSEDVSERAMLVEALECLGPDDVLVLDRGYPAAWLIQLLNERGIRFVIRCDSSSSFSAVREFMRGQQSGKSVLLNAPSARDASDWGCARQAPAVRLVRHTTPDGCTRVLVTNIGAELVAAAEFAELYHRRWRIEEAFKRLKHRMKLESVSGLSQHALIIDVAAKILADNLASLMCTAAAAAAPQVARRCNRAYAAQVCARMLAPVLLCIGDVASLVGDAIALMARVQQRFVAGRSRPRPAHHLKPHPSQAYKG
jgi:hypothetical protein